MRFAELQKRVKRPNSLRGRLGTEEVLIDDARGLMRPGDFIEQKLLAVQRTDERSRSPLGSDDESDVHST